SAVRAAAGAAHAGGAAGRGGGSRKRRATRQLSAGLQPLGPDHRGAVPRGTGCRRRRTMTPQALELMRIMGWGLIATALLPAISFAAQNLGWSRLNFPMLLGTLFTGDRAAANVLGFVLYLLVGWLIALLYYLLVALLGASGWLAWLAVGLLHALLLLTVSLRLLPHI